MVAARVAVLAPSLGLSVTIEDHPASDEIHVHAGGQGFWLARILAVLDVPTTLVVGLGGESGRLLPALLDHELVEVRAVMSSGASGVWIDDRRSGTRRRIAEQPTEPLGRHDQDDLYGAAFVAALQAGTIVLPGPGIPPVVRPGFYRRFAADARANDVRVVADVSGGPLEELLDSGFDVLKVSAADLQEDGEPIRTRTEVVAAGRRLAASGGAVIVTRAHEGAIVIDGEDAWVAAPPEVDAFDRHGTGDTFTGALTAALVNDATLVEAVCLGTAAGALNATRRGLGSGSRREIDLLAQQVRVVPLE